MDGGSCLRPRVPILGLDVSGDRYRGPGHSSGADVRLAADAMRQLSKLPWPGNVAQLRRVVAETVARQRSGVIGADKLPPECRSLAKRKLTQMEALERDAIVRSLEDNANNKLQAAIALGMSRATIYRKMRDYGIA